MSFRKIVKTTDKLARLVELPILSIIILLPLILVIIYLLFA